MASIETLGPEEQMLVEYLNGNMVYNGPSTKLYNPFRERTKRGATRLGPTEYARIKDKLTGAKRVQLGPDLVFLEAYEEDEGKREKYVLKKDQYIRFYHRVNGTEKVYKGPTTVVPDAWEESEEGVQQAAFINTDSAVLVLNLESGEQKLVAPPGVTGDRIETAESGVYFPVAYEVLIERRKLVRVLPHETMIMREATGLYRVISGADGDGTGTSFFLPPYAAIVTQKWSTFSDPVPGQAGQTITYRDVDRIDMRSRKIFFQYEVRTNDNVNLRVEGTIFWKIGDVAQMIKVTADPSGDVWHHARSALIQAVSNITLQEFTAGFNPVVKRAFDAQQTDGFYTDRGLEMQSMEVIKYECVDPEVATTLELIIRERVNRINRMQKQRSENDIENARIDADISLEKTKEQLIAKQAYNEKLLAIKEGESEGTRLAMGASTFVEGLEDSLPDIDKRVELYRLHKRMLNQNEKTHHLASGKATVFLQPEAMDLNLQYGTEL